MDDMNAFDRQLASVVLQRVGPSRPVDDAAIFTAITTTQSPKWRFQSMFSVARFVVAGAIVALFGGFLLAGLLSQPSDDMAPAAVTASPSPSTTEDVLSSMITEEVEPGVLRVLDDGAGHDLVAEPPADMTLASDGSVWLLRRSSHPDPEMWPDTPEWVDAVIRLGQSGTYPFQAAETYDYQRSLAVGPDGVAWTNIGSYGHALGMLASLDGSAWSYPAWPDGSADVAAIDAMPDGLVWVTQQVTDGPGPRVARIEDGEWTVLPALEDPTLSGFFHGAGRYFAAAPDGTAWLANGDFHRCFVAPAPQGLLYFDGTRWELVDTQVDGRSWMAGPLALGPDGTLWVYLERPSPCGASSRNGRPGYLARLDADGWRLFTAQADGVPRMVHFGYRDADMAVDADGTLWVGHYRDGVLAFDGSDWRQYLAGMDVNRVVVTPQGSVLATVRSRSENEPYSTNGSEAGLYVITPEAVAANT
jgi:hypothetical protein